MIYLFAATDIINTTVSSAATVSVDLNYIKVAKGTGVLSDMGYAKKLFAGAGNDDTLAGPGGTDCFTLKQGTWWNGDASLAAVVTITKKTTGPVNLLLFSTTLQPGEGIVYIEGAGFYPIRPANGLDKVIIMAADSVHATAATFADITGMQVPMLSGKKYIVKATLFHTNDASTTGSRFAYNIGAAPTLALFGNVSAVTNSVTAGVVATGTATARDTAVTAQTTGQTATGMTQLEGMIQPSADGTFSLRAASEISVAAGLTVKAGSFMEVRQER